MKKISSEHLAHIRDISSRREAEAQRMGVAVIEFEQAKASIYQRFAARPKSLQVRLGAAAHELEMHKRSIMARVESLVVQQREVGEHAMREVGVNPQERGTDFTIDLKTGEVLSLRDNAWISIEG